MGLVRAWQRLLKVARTIADLESCGDIEEAFARSIKLSRDRPSAAASAKDMTQKRGLSPFFIISIVRFGVVFYAFYLWLNRQTARTLLAA